MIGLYLDFLVANEPEEIKCGEIETFLSIDYNMCT